MKTAVSLERRVRGRALEEGGETTNACMAIGVKRSTLGQLLLGHDPHMPIRVAMTGASALLSVLWGSLAFLLAYVGFASVQYTLIWLGTTVVCSMRPRW